MSVLAAIQPGMDDIVALPVGFVPTPTMETRQRRKLKKVTEQPGQPTPQAPTLPAATAGCRVLIWKQDPSVPEIGIRKAFLPGPVTTGPRDARITNGAGTNGLPPVSPNVFGDFIQTPGTPAFDTVHSYAVVRETLTLYQRARGGAPLPWQWNGPNNTDPLSVYPHGLPGVMNAFYSRNDRALRFGDFIRQGSNPPQRIFTCRSLDIVSHECGHAILDGLKPGWLQANNPPQTGGLHESFGDLTAIFLALSQMDQVEAVIAQTKANLHEKTFLSDLAEEFGLALGRPNGLRNADNDLKLSQVGTEVHAISQVFTGGIYDVLADIFAFEQRPTKKDDAQVLYEVGQYLMSLVIRAIMASPATGATFANVVNQMLLIANADGRPVQYRNFIRNRFTFREVVVSPTPLTEDHAEGLELACGVEDAEDAVQNRRGCCGTMQLAEFTGPDEGEEHLFHADYELLKKTIHKEFRTVSAGSSARSTANERVR
ncbi:MAG: hypothetical protein HY040_27770 [Planctomycetes bacterium]|nr:hypothetical protein [Planctomycetota bacterium]